MRDKILAFTIRCMVKLLKLEGALPLPPATSVDMNIQKMLAPLWANKDFRAYLTFREQRIVYELTGAAGLKEIDRADFIRFTGQRVENLLLGTYARSAYLAWEKEKAARARKEEERQAREEA